MRWVLEYLRSRDRPRKGTGIVAGRWESYWFAPVPAHISHHAYTPCGCCLVSLPASRTVGTFGALDGLSPCPDNPDGARTWLLARGSGRRGGRAFFGYSVNRHGGDVVGFRSDAAVMAPSLDSCCRRTGTVCRCPPRTRWPCPCSSA